MTALNNEIEENIQVTDCLICFFVYAIRFILESELMCKEEKRKTIITNIHNCYMMTKKKRKCLFAIFNLLMEELQNFFLESCCKLNSFSLFYVSFNIKEI